MIARSAVPLLLTALLAAPTNARGAPEPSRPTLQDFDTEDTGTPYVLDHAGAEPKAGIQRGSLWLVNGGRQRGPLEGTLGFPRTAPGLHRRVRASFSFACGFGAEGASFLLLDTAAHGTEGAPPAFENRAEPNVEGAFAVALDTFNPPTSHWFDGHGNVHGRPEREVSLHWNGREVHNVLSPVEYRDQEEHRFDLDLEFVPGGAAATVRVDDTVVINRHFVPGMVPFESRAAFAAETGETALWFVLDDVDVRWEDPVDDVAAATAPPLRVRTFDRAVVHQRANTATGTFDLPAGDFARVVLHLTLHPGPGGWDIWDRRGAIYAYTGEGDDRQAFEIVRFMTPFAREWTWSVDVTDSLPLLQGETELGVYVSTIGPKADDPADIKGFAATVDFDYTAGTPARRPIAVVPVLTSRYRFGNAADAIAQAFPAVDVALPAGATAAKIRFWVTGHGGFGEFTPHWRKLTIGDRTIRDRLWTTDVYLNACRPQGGTWKFDRTGWAPGDVCPPWEIEVEDLPPAGQPLRIRYLPEPYPDRPLKIAADHWIEGQVIVYGR